MRRAARGTRWLRCLVGTYANQLREYPVGIAEMMLREGRAEEPDVLPPDPPALETATVKPPASKRTRSRRRKS